MAHAAKYAVNTGITLDCHVVFNGAEAQVSGFEITALSIGIGISRTTDNHMANTIRDGNRIVFYIPIGAEIVCFRKTANNHGIVTIGTRKSYSIGIGFSEVIHAAYHNIV